MDSINAVGTASLGEVVTRCPHQLTLSVHCANEHTNRPIVDSTSNLASASLRATLQVKSTKTDKLFSLTLGSWHVGR